MRIAALFIALLLAAPAAAQLSPAQLEGGLREALRVAAQRTVQRVGRPGGYLNDAAIRIPLPSQLETARRGLAAVGQAGLLDDLQTRMNRAAEQAAPRAFDILANAVRQMSVSDARGIVGGPRDAATQYLKRTSTGPLTQSFRPIIDRALADAGAVQAMQSVQALGSLGRLAGFNLTDFATEKALAGLFHYIAQEEAAIRANPAARSSELLRQVFGR